MPEPNEPMEHVAQEGQVSPGLEQTVESCESALRYEKPTIRKVDESRHGDFWCD